MTLTDDNTNHPSPRDYRPEENVCVCSDCAAGISNDDWSHLDWGPEWPNFYYTGKTHRNLKKQIDEFLEMGWLSLVGPSEEDDFSCGSKADKPGVIFERSC